MRKLTTLLLTVGLIVSSFTSASAGEFKPSLRLINSYEFANAGSDTQARGFGDDSSMLACLRMHLFFDYIASENLSATFMMRFGETYGALSDGTQGAMFDSSMTGTLGVRLAYLDWTIPSTDVHVRMGYQPITMPSFAFKSAVVNSRGGGVTVSAPINENISVSALWMRTVTGANEEYNADNPDDQHSGHDDADIIAVVGDFNYDGFRFAPWAMYMMLGSNVSVLSYDNKLLFGNALGDADMSSYWLGASFELSMFDPFIFAIDALYSDVNVNNNVKYAEGPQTLDSAGAYFVGASASYKTSNGTPALKGWYTSGNSEDATTFTVGAPIALAAYFSATTIMFGDQVMDNGIGAYTVGSTSGTWGILLEWADMSFMEKLRHTARIAYMGGTNDFSDAFADARTDPLKSLDTGDKLVEFNFNSTYDIYKNLFTTLELGYLALDLDRANTGDRDKDIFRAALVFVYDF